MNEKFIAVIGAGVIGSDVALDLSIHNRKSPLQLQNISRGQIMPQHISNHIMENERNLIILLKLQDDTFRGTWYICVKTYFDSE